MERQLESALTDAVTESDVGVVCSLKDVPYISSAGLRRLLVLAKREIVVRSNPNRRASSDCETLCPRRCFSKILVSHS